MSETQKLTGEFIAGFVEGEGCFSLNYDKHRYGKKTYIYLRSMFSIGLNKKDKELLEKIREFIGCGSIYLDIGNRKKYKNANHDCYSYRVFRKDDLQNILIPFFDKYQFQGSKKIAFEVFKEIMGVVSKRKAGQKSKDEEKLLKLKRKLINYDGRKHAKKEN